MRKRKKSQSILEYIIILSAIIVTVIWAASENGPIRTGVKNMFDDSAQLITDKSSDFLARAAGGSSAVE